MTLYTKNAKDEFVPVEIKSVIDKDLNNHLIIVRVGSDKYPATPEDLERTAKSFSEANVLDNLDNISIILTPYQIEVNSINNAELEDKSVYIQISAGDDVGALDKMTRSLYEKLKNNYKVVVLPTPLKMKDYKEVENIIKRCETKKKRRAARR